MKLCHWLIATDILEVLFWFSLYTKIELCLHSHCFFFAAPPRWLNKVGPCKSIPEETVASYSNISFVQ
jgi:hypothetical protein